MLENVYYINLENRTDRKTSVENELNSLGWKYQRFNAIKTKDGRVGCSMSHLKLLKMAKEKNLDYIVIVEDDIQFMRKTWYNERIKNIMDTDFDVFLLAGNLRPPIFQTNYENIVKVSKSFTTTGYIVKKHYYDKLIDNIDEGIRLLLKNPGGEYNDNAIDCHWMKLQKNDKWYIVMPRTITQRPIYSDIEQRYTDYNHLMLDDIKDISKDINFIHDNILKQLNYLQIKDYYFIHIPKNAGTSIINQFFKLDNKIGTHYNINYYPNNIRKKTFAICRNPYTRLVSCYNYFKMKKSYWHSNDGSTPYGLHELYNYCNKNTFDIFVKDLCVNNKFTNNIHLLPQYKWIITPDNKIVSKIIKIENINKELSELFNEKIDLIKINKSKSNCDDYYTLESKQLVYEYYKRDFEYFEYCKDF